MADIPPPPPGFTLNPPKQGASAVPPPPPGFTLNGPVETAASAASAPDNSSILEKLGKTAVNQLKGAADIPRDIGQEFGQAKQAIGTGISRLKKGYDVGDVNETAVGLGQAGLGAMRAVGSPIAGAAQAMVGDPLRQSGLPGAKRIGDVAEFGAGMIGPGVLGKMAGEVPGMVRAAGSIPGRVASSAKVAAGPVSNVADMKQLAAGLYAKADAKGANFTPQLTDKFVSHAAGTLPQTAAGKAVAGPNEVSALVDRLQAIKGKPLSLNEVQEIDEHMGDLIDKQYGVKGLSKEGKHIQDLQTEFRNMVHNAGPGEIQPGANGMDDLKAGRKAWSQAMKMSDIDRLQTRAELSDVPSTVFRNGIKTILANPTKLRGYTPDEQAALRSAVKTGAVDTLLRHFGSRLTPMMAEGAGASIGGLPGFIAGAGIGTAGSAAARAGANLRQGNRAQTLLNTLGKNGTP